MQLFGINLFTFKKQSGEKMYDFAQHGIIRTEQEYWAVTQLVERVESESTPAKKKGKKKKKIDEPIRMHITPKGLYLTKALNDNNFSIKIDKEYLEKQISDCRLKLSLMYSGKKKKKSRSNGPEGFSSSEGGPEGYGKLELESIIERLQNRFKIKEVKETLEKYPHTTSDKINEILETHKDVLRFKKAADFIPDFPTEAVEAMAEYNKMCQVLCGKDTSFYVLAQRKDFEKVQKRRDPILFAQSPLGFFWQILGAWDEEMIYLGDL